MRVLYDYAAFVMQSCGGVSRVLYDLFRHVSERPDTDCKLFAGFHRNQYLCDAPASVKQHIVGWHLPEEIVKQRIFMPINRYLFRCYARRFQPDICHHTYLQTPRVPVGCKEVVSIQDMIHERFPAMFSPSDPQRAWKKNAVNRADGVICPSATTRSDLERFIDLQGKPVEVIHYGNSMQGVLPASIDFPYPYLLYVGSRGVQYKNFELVLQALTRCKDQTDMHLACFGGNEFSIAELRLIEDRGLTGRVHRFGGSDAQLAAFYTGARALIYPSLYEGFGLPPIEAMGFGCPVLSSSAPPMPEIIGGAAWYFDPTSVEAAAAQLVRLHDEAERASLIYEGRIRAAEFSWTQTADVTVAFYRSLG
ncbi:MAG: glycosyltransferase family 1 protein [Verrucomicrobia bacterium]|nr:glycosyltransferase family 1 protein [Verrucomicrobiota bacterium]MDA1087548.1 glycosyltransferase family 1 protein [Verrucomicrobiota bacterium]